MFSFTKRIASSGSVKQLISAVGRVSFKTESPPSRMILSSSSRIMFSVLSRFSEERKSTATSTPRHSESCEIIATSGILRPVSQLAIVERCTWIRSANCCCEISFFRRSLRSVSAKEIFTAAHSFRFHYTKQAIQSQGLK